MKKYQIIYADPPWQFKNYSDKWHKNNVKSRWVANHYKIETTKDICNIPINTISDKNCILFIWATFPKLPDCLEVIKSWDFVYKTIGFNWIKKNKKANTFFWGMGFWTRANSEICLLATKGNPKRVSASVHSIINTPVEKHSQKPNMVRDKIIELMGDLPRIELFAREKTENWDVWGNEVENDIKL